MTDSIADALKAAGDRAAQTSSTTKKNYAERLSRALSTRVANALRPTFPGILPNPDGSAQESRARTSKGFAKLDVNYSTPELGLGLGVSIKTLNFRDGGSNRYTKNYTRVDKELRAEAADYHERQPYAVMVALFFLPADSCSDARMSESSFGAAVKTFRLRARRREPTDAPELFERVFIGLYETDPDKLGEVGFFDVEDRPPKAGRPAKLLTFSEMIAAIVSTYDARNVVSFEWADAAPEAVIAPEADDDAEED